jgi:hypothetical protein
MSGKYDGPTWNNQRLVPAGTALLNMRLGSLSSILSQLRGSATCVKDIISIADARMADSQRTCDNTSLSGQPSVSVVNFGDY